MKLRLKEIKPEIVAMRHIRNLPFFARELVRQDDARKLASILFGRRFNFARRDVHGETLLLFAASRGRMQCARVILWYMQNRGVPIAHLNTADTGGIGRTTLQHAVLKNDFEFASDLLCCGADMRVQNQDSHTALSLAAGEQRAPLRQLLSNTWQVRRWSPALHAGTPIDFQREACTFTKVNWELRALSKDMLVQVLEWLLQSHREEWLLNSARTSMPTSWRSLVHNG